MHLICGILDSFMPAFQPDPSANVGRISAQTLEKSVSLLLPRYANAYPQTCNWTSAAKCLYITGTS